MSGADQHRSFLIRDILGRQEDDEEEEDTAAGGVEGTTDNTDTGMCPSPVLSDNGAKRG